MRAVFSACMTYRYRLTRGIPDSQLAFVMLNPSTADAEIDDPTIRRCIGFANREGRDGIVVCNVYGFRATSPADMLAAADPFGPENAAHLDRLAQSHDAIVCAWGANVRPNDARATAAILTRYGAQLLCFGTTSAGQPRHPLYLRGDSPLRAWAAP